jgi:hypothetical protein
MQPKQPNEDPFMDPALLLGLNDRLTRALELTTKELEQATKELEEFSRELEQARSIATLLEAECANCWGPIHKDAIEQAQALTRIEEATDVEG